MVDKMKIKVLDDIDEFKTGQIIDAIVNKHVDRAITLNTEGYKTICFYKEDYPRFSLMVGQIEDETNERKTRGFTIEELKQLKELFK